MHSAVYSMAQCPSVCHKPVLYTEWIQLGFGTEVTFHLSFTVL